MATNRVKRCVGLGANGGAGAGSRILPTQQDVCWYVAPVEHLHSIVVIGPWHQAVLAASCGDRLSRAAVCVSVWMHACSKGAVGGTLPPSFPVNCACPLPPVLILILCHHAAEMFYFYFQVRPRCYLRAWSACCSIRTRPSAYHVVHSEGSVINC